MGVTEISVPPRSNSVTPSSSSSLRMATDNVGWLTKQASAARPKWRSLATATTYFTSVKVILFSNYANIPDAVTSNVWYALALRRDDAFVNTGLIVAHDEARGRLAASRQNVIRLVPPVVSPGIRQAP